MNAPFRVVIASRDEAIRILLEKLLHVLRAEVFHADDEAGVLARVGTPEGVQAVVIDGAWTGFSLAGLRQAAQASRSGIPFIALLAEGALAEVVSSFAAGVDSVLPRHPDPQTFLNTFRGAQRFAALENRLRALELAAAQSAHPPQEDGKDESLLPEPEERIEPPMLPILHTPDGRPQLVAQMEEAVIQVCVSLGVDPDDITTKPATGRLLRGDIVGWQGAFLPQSRTWYDILFHFTRPGAEHLAQLLAGRSSPDENDLVNAVASFLITIQGTHRKLFETGGKGVAAASTTLFSPPLAAPRPRWADEAGEAANSQLIKFPHLFMVYDFHASPGVARVKPFAAIEPGDVLNEPIVPRGEQRRIPIANRGVVLNKERLDKIGFHVQPSQTLWVIEPSLLTRQLHRD